MAETEDREDRALPESMFWIVSISAGGNSYGALPIPEAPTSQ